MEINLGDRIRFFPAGWTHEEKAGYTPPAWMQAYAEGTVVQIHEEHHWLRVRYETRLGVCHECFKLPVLHDRLTRVKA